MLTSPFRTLAQANAKTAPKGKQAQTGKSANAAGNTKNIQLSSEAELEKTMLELEKTMEKLETRDLKQIKAELERAAKELDVARMEAEVQQSLKAVDSKNIRQQMERALKAADLAQMQAKALRQMDWEKMEKQLETAQTINYEQMALQMAEATVQMEKAGKLIGPQLEKAREEMKKTQQEMKLMQQGVLELKKDGLIKDGEELNIEWDSNTLIINGSRQPAAVSEKYRKYFGRGIIRMSGAEGRSPKFIH
jgi:hypothetical protein